MLHGTDQFENEHHGKTIASRPRGPWEARAQPFAKDALGLIVPGIDRTCAPIFWIMCHSRPKTVCRGARRAHAHARALARAARARTGGDDVPTRLTHVAEACSSETLGADSSGRAMAAPSTSWMARMTASARSG